MTCQHLSCVNLPVLPIHMCVTLAEHVCYSGKTCVLFWQNMCVTLAKHGVQVDALSVDGLLANIHFFRVRDYVEQVGPMCLSQSKKVVVCHLGWLN
jgi:hypothetical protein